MGSDPVLDALEAAVRAQPDSIELRAHLIKLHLSRLPDLPSAEAHDVAVTEARRHLGEILRADPQHDVVQGLLGDLWHAPTVGTLARSSEVAGEGADSAFVGSTRSTPHPPPTPGTLDAPTPPSDPSLVPTTPVDESEAGGDPADWEQPATTLDDVAGMDDVKERLELVVFGPARRPDLAEAFGRAGRGGLLLWGPPGCGKTFLARAVAGELGVNFGSVGIDAVLDQWLGGSERNLASLFAAARGKPPCVLFLDEVDAIGQRRSRLRSEHLRTVLTQLLVELDGVDRDNRGLFVVGASNLPWDVDPALRRPGRFDRSVFVPPPDAAARARILADGLVRVPLGTVDIPAIVSRTAGCSGADMVHVVDTAADLALSESIKDDAIVPLEQVHLERAVAQVEPSIADWVATAKDAATWSGDESLFGPFLAWLERWERGR